MAILIDGYNFLHASGIFSPAVGPGSLIKLHQALLDFLIRHLSSTDIPQTTVVFDAKGRRATSRRSLEHSGITVHYSSRFEEADLLLAELIDAHRDPRQLLVVSSDHQVQRAARRRRAKPIDSEVWYAQLVRERRERARSAAQAADAKPFAPLTESEAAWWLQQFSPDLLEELERDAPLAGSTPQKSTAEPADNAAKSQRPDASPAEPTPLEETNPVNTPRVDPPARRPKTLAAEDSPFPQSYLEAIERELLNGPPRLEKVNAPPKRKRRKP